MTRRLAGLRFSIDQHPTMTGSPRTTNYQTNLDFRPLRRARTPSSDSARAHPRYTKRTQQTNENNGSHIRVGISFRENRVGFVP